jgi:hypothetical protein
MTLCTFCTFCTPSEKKMGKTVRGHPLPFPNFLHPILGEGVGKNWRSTHVFEAVSRDLSHGACLVRQ